MRLLLLLVVVFGMVFWFLRPPPRPLPTEGVRLKGVEFYLFPEEEAVEWRFTAQEMSLIHIIRCRRSGYCRHR
ncbi:hypothetical protein [Thermus scotoductus]|uniref:hypothetical protein n=1 Tax=Thermus scotoductus TaxID=37636 RepID=UPI0015624834|nr:hypothetical protein [Thermus scotoductus]